MLNIITYGNKLLTLKSELVTEIDENIKSLINKMFETMYFTNGIGLAAVQVGIPKRLFVVDIPKENKIAMINPVIHDRAIKTSKTEEGCLSIPGIAHEIERSKTIEVEYLDEFGKKNLLKASGLLATCIQHEYDHLEGILFIDRLPPEDRLKKLKEYNNLHII
jgi:peptide deformylase